MKVLAVETSAKVSSVALCDENGLIAEFITNHKLTHSEQLLPMVDSVLKSVSQKIDEIDLFAVAQGPGSFTGIRIGITTVKGFAYALKKPIVTVNSLEALAYNVSIETHLVCSMLDARNNQVFCGIFRASAGEYRLVGNYMALDILELVQRIKDGNIATAFVGDAVDLHKDIIQRELGQLAYFPSSLNSHQRAYSVGYLGILKFKKGLVTDSINAEPFYLRKSQAEQELEKRQAEQEFERNKEK